MKTRQETADAVMRLVDVQRRLRRDCPWDRKQTFESLRPNTIEEVYELCDALSRGDLREVMKELGDVMEHVVFYSLLGEEQGAFDLADVCHQQSDKLMFRHPFINWNTEGHWTVTNPDMVINADGQVVYRVSSSSTASGPSVAASTDGGRPQTADEVLSTWEQVKQRERGGNKTVLSGVPSALPSLVKAYRVQEKAANVGFDWRHADEVWDKVREELSELEAELRRGDKEASLGELGDFIFSVVNAARLYHLNPDNALERTNHKFIARFGHVERRAKETGRDVKDLTLEEMDQLWNEAKKQETNQKTDQ